MLGVFPHLPTSEANPLAREIVREAYDWDPIDLMPVIVYVKLLEEGTDVLRPVHAKRVEQGIYDLSANQKDDEEIWEFPPGSRVCVKAQLMDSVEHLVAISLAP